MGKSRSRKPAALSKPPSMGGNLGPSFLFLLLGGGWVHCVSCNSDCDRSMASPSASWVAFGDDS